MRCFKLAGSIAALLAGLAVASAGFAQPPCDGPPPGGGPGPFGGPPPGRGPDRFIEEHAAQLGLDDETVDAIDQIVDESREKAQELHAGLRDMHREMRELLSQDAPDESTVMRQADAIGEAETELHKHRIGALIKIRALLTDEQREELRGIREETRTQWREHLVDSCGADIDRFCPDADDPWSRRGCVRHHWEELSSDCQNAVEAARARAHRGHHRGKHHGRSPRGEF
jgi:Spy/CpxP family protein refolding chaperone